MTHMDSANLTRQRFEHQEKRTEEANGWGSTTGALGIASTFIGQYAVIVSERWSDLKPASLRNSFNQLGDHRVALAAITTGLGLSTNIETVSRIVETLGATLEDERYGHELVNWDATYARMQEETVKKVHRNVKIRKTALKSLARKKGFRFIQTPRNDILKVGAWLLDILTRGPVFELGKDGFFTLSEDAMSVHDSVIAHAIESNPVFLPSKVPCDPWRSSVATIQGHRSTLVRSRSKAVQKAVSGAVRSGRMSGLLEAVNAEQRVAWRINKPIKDLVRWCYENGVHVEGLPPKEDLAIASHPEWETMSDTERKLWKINASQTRGLNRAYLGQRLMLSTDLATADWLTGGPFWTPCNLDYRGRMYPIPSFNFQRGDYVRAMFKFAKGKPLGKHGLYWLKVHVANCGDFGKVSKKSFDERVKWVDDNYDLIGATADNPWYVRDWTKADKPFLFVAACQALIYATLTDYCDIPISFDGSCSGLQHLGAMTRDSQTAQLVNLTPDAQPQDVYQVVADSVKWAATHHLTDPIHTDQAKLALTYGVTRKLVKRNVMTFCYGSKKFGMADQHREDTMTPLRYDVMSGKLKEHPFGEDHGYKASIYLAGITYDSIRETVKGPHEAMEFLRDIAAVMSHEGKAVHWTTPLGLPVVLHYPPMILGRLSLWLNDKGVPLRKEISLPSEGPGVSKRKAMNAIAPSFVHSYDANHLHMVVLGCKQEGITDLALVHDSFGFQAGDAERGREIIKEQFHKQYTQHDVLRDILQEAHGSIEDHTKLPSVPTKGDYDIELVLDSDYAFA